MPDLSAGIEHLLWNNLLPHVQAGGISIFGGRLMFNSFSSRLGIAALAFLGLGAAVAAADTITFAGFNDTAANRWTYTNGTISGTGVPANFISYGPPNKLLNYTGPVTYSVSATSTGAPITSSTGVVSQTLTGQMTFRNGPTTILAVTFAGAIISGENDSQSTHIGADTNLVGNIVSFTSSPGVQLGDFVPPLSFSIALTQIPSITVSGSNLTNFTATASGTFASENPGGAGIPEPSSLALLGLSSLALLRRRKTEPVA
jgi:hypothetical protein